MASTAGRDPHEPVELLNPYRTPPTGPDVRGVAFGRAGLVAGVIAVAVAPLDPLGSGGMPPETPVWLGSGLAVAEEISEPGISAGYLWPAPPGPVGRSAPSPARYR